MSKYLSLPLVLFGLFGPASAQETGLSIGLITLSGADLAGNSYFNAFPLIQYETGPWTFGGADLVSYDWGNQQEGLRGNIGIGFDFGQDIGGAPKLGFATALDAGIVYRFPYFEISGDMSQRLGSGAGNLLTFGIGSGYPISKNLFLGAAFDLEWADTARREAFYNLPSAGILGSSLSFAAIGSLGEQQSYIVGISRTTPSSEIANLSFTSNSAQIEFILSYAYNL